jgi:uncharacterized membrane protein YfcA
MSTQIVLVLLLVGLAAGVLGGLVGIGGGIVIVPALVYFMGYSQKMAQGTSLGILLLPVGILAVWNFYKQGYVDPKAVWLVSAGFVIGGYFGSKIALALPQDTVKKVFACMLIVVALKCFSWTKRSRKWRRETKYPRCFRVVNREA